jgi:hypothetical protein
MRVRETTTTWLPSTQQIVSAPERAILASLDANLELAIRVLKAEHVDLLPDGRLSWDPDYEPFTAALLPIAEAMVICAEHLQRLVIEYRTLVDGLLADSEGNNRDTAGDEDDTDMPF